MMTDTFLRSHFLQEASYYQSLFSILCFIFLYSMPHPNSQMWCNTFIYWWLEISNIKPTLNYYLLFSFSLSTRMSNKPFVICWSTKMTNIYFIISLFGIFNSYHVSSSAIDWNYAKEILKGNIDELKNVNALNAFASRPNGGNDDPTVCNLWFIMSTIYWKILKV